MVNVGNKSITNRVAIAQAIVIVNDQVMNKIKNQEIKKGDVLNVARIAGILSAKKTSSLIPLCHPVQIDDIQIIIDPFYEPNKIKIKAKVNSLSKTGVEMEALTAVSIASLTIYDMCKAVDSCIIIQEVKLVLKKGGKKDFISED